MVKQSDKQRIAIQDALIEMLERGGVPTSYTLTGEVADTILDAIRNPQLGTPLRGDEDREGRDL